MSLQNKKTIEEQNGLTEREWWIIAVLILIASATVYITYAHNQVARGKQATTGTPSQVAPKESEAAGAPSQDISDEEIRQELASTKHELDDAKRLYNDALKKLWDSEDEKKRLMKENDNWRNRVADLEDQIKE